MSDPAPVVSSATVSATPTSVTATSTTPAVKSGFATTELYLAVVLLAGLAYAVQQLINILPSLAANPAIPPWAAALIPIAVTGLGFVAKLVVSEYTTLRGQLKLGASSDPSVSNAVTAGAAAQAGTDAAALAAVNK